LSGDTWIASWWLAGGSATDDPEGEIVLEEVRREAKDDPDIHLLNLPPWSATEINAPATGLHGHRAEKSARGIRTDVTEALWKKKPVVASAVGGIPAQVIHKHTGLLVHSVEGTAYQIRFLLSNPASGTQTGRTGTRTRARELSDYHERETLPYDFPPFAAAIIIKTG